MQTLHAHEDAVWTMKFSHAGEYLATAGQDRIVRVWALDRERADAEPASGSSRGNLRLKGQNLFREKPHREYAGHRGDVVDLCWSHTDWLLSSSMDKTVRLWYMTMDECLRIFSHQDFVTAIDFNPVNDKYFLSGSLDGKLRFWNIPDHRVADWVDIGEMVTAATFNSDGSVAVAGSYKGKCHFYGMDGVRFDYLTHLDVRNSRSKKTQGKKITGLTFMPGDDRKLLVTSNDSRIRVYDGYALACKYKGHKNDNLLIRASFSPGAEFIVCGSEDENVYVWSTINSFVPSINPIYTGYRRDKHSSYESFAAQSDISTVALLAEEVRRARTGRAAAEVAAARASVKTDIQATPAAAALFKGAPVSPMMDAACRGVEADGAGDDGAAGDDRPSDGTRAKAAGRKAPPTRADPRARSEEGGGAAEPRADPRAEARAEGERAFAAGMAIGQIIVTAGYSGEIRDLRKRGRAEMVVGLKKCSAVADASPPFPRRDGLYSRTRRRPPKRFRYEKNPRLARDASASSSLHSSGSSASRRSASETSASADDPGLGLGGLGGATPARVNLVVASSTLRRSVSLDAPNPAIFALDASNASLARARSVSTSVSSAWIGVDEPKLILANLIHRNAPQRHAVHRARHEMEDTSRRVVVLARGASPVRPASASASPRSVARRDARGYFLSRERPIWRACRAGWAPPWTPACSPVRRANARPLPSRPRSPTPTPSSLSNPRSSPRCRVAVVALRTFGHLQLFSRRHSSSFDWSDSRSDRIAASAVRISFRSAAVAPAPYPVFPCPRAPRPSLDAFEATPNASRAFALRVRSPPRTTAWRVRATRSRRRAPSLCSVNAGVNASRARASSRSRSSSSRHSDVSLACSLRRDVSDSFSSAKVCMSSCWRSRPRWSARRSSVMSSMTRCSAAISPSSPAPSEPRKDTPSRRAL